MGLVDSNFSFSNRISITVENKQLTISEESSAQPTPIQDLGEILARSLQEIKKSNQGLDNPEQLQNFVAQYGEKLEASGKEYFGRFWRLVKIFQRIFRFGSINTLRKINTTMKALENKTETIHVVFKKIVTQAVQEPRRMATAPSQLPTLENRIQARIKQLSNLEIERKPLKAQEIAKLAAFIEEQIVPVQKIANTFFPVIKGQLPRRIQVDLKDRAVYVISDPTKTNLKAAGALKKVTSAARVILNTYAEPDQAVQVVPKENSKEVLEELEKEFQFFELLKDIPGLAKFYVVTDFTNVVGRKKVPSKHAFMQRAMSDLAHITQKVALPQQISIATQLVTFFKEMHARGYIHADIKAANILLYKDGTIGVTDFGMTFKKTGKPTYMFDLGYYSTAKYSAPELFGHRNFRADFEKTEVWSLGQLLYKLYFQKDAPGIELIEAHDKKNFDDKKMNFKSPEVLKKYQDDFAVLIQEKIEKPYAELLKKKQRTANENYELLIYSMLRLDPKTRVSMAEARNLLS